MSKKHKRQKMRLFVPWSLNSCVNSFGNTIIPINDTDNVERSQNNLDYCHAKANSSNYLLEK